MLSAFQNSGSQSQMIHLSSVLTGFLHVWTTVATRWDANHCTMSCVGLLPNDADPAGM